MGEPAPAPAAEERVKRATRRGRGAAAFVAVPSAFAAPPTIDARVDQANPRFGDSFGYVVTATVDGSLVDSARIVERRRTVHAARADGREAIDHGRRRRTSR